MEEFGGDEGGNVSCDGAVVEARCRISGEKEVLNGGKMRRLGASFLILRRFG